MRRLSVQAATLGFLLLAGPRLAQAQCTKDVDCQAEQICEAGTCTEPAAQSAPPMTSPRRVTSAPHGLSAPRVISVESPPVEAPPHFERRSPMLVAGGAIAASIGLVAIVVGISSSGSTCHYELSDRFKVEHCERSPNYAAYAIGGLLIAGSVPMIVVGGKKVLASTEAQLAPWVSPQGGGLALRLPL